MGEIKYAVPRSSVALADARDKWSALSRFVSSVPLLVLLLVLIALRCWVAGRVDFETDEAYYWLWSQKLAGGYFDHPPMVAYLIRLGTFLFGNTIFGIRSMAILAMIAASALLYILALLLFGERRFGLLALLWFNTMPHTAFFSLVMYPDTPAILFWVLCCVGLALVWRSGRGQWWYLVGIGLGLLLLSKYTGVFLLFGIAGWLAASQDMRFWLKRREPYLAGLIALIMFSPVIAWNAEHGWASFIKQFGRALDSSADGGLANLGAFIGIQAAFVSPLIFAFAIVGLAVAAWRGWRLQQADWLLLVAVSAPMLLYFLVHALTAEVLPQWPSAVYPAAILAGVATFAPRANNPARRLSERCSFEAAPWVGLLFTLVLFAQLTVRPVSIAAGHDPLSRFAGWAGLASQTRALAAAHGADYIATNHYGTNATLAFYLRDMTVFQTSEAIRYVFQPPIDQALLGRATGIYVAALPSDDIARLQQHFDSVAFIATIWRNRDGDPIEPYRVYELKGYRGGVPF